MTEGRGPDARAKEGVATVGLAAVVLICCAALPLLAALAGGIAVGAVLGVGAGAFAIVALIALVVVRRGGGHRY